MISLEDKRLPRSGYFGHVLLVLIGCFFTMLFLFSNYEKVSPFFSNGNDPTNLGVFFGFIFLIISIIALTHLLLVPAITHRLWDVNIDGLFVLIILGLPIFAFYFTTLLFALFLFWSIILILGCIPGTKGPNRFGPDPLDTSSQTVQQEGNTQ